jgi:molybdenum cofactor cytidylyltransferase
MKGGGYAAIILAAGFSSRMGRFKPLLPLGKETITDHLIATYLRNGVDVYLVVGYRQEELRAAVKARHVRIVENPDYPRGMFTGVLAGLRSLKDGYRGAFVNPVDIPLVSPATIRKGGTRPLYRRRSSPPSWPPGRMET